MQELRLSPSSMNDYQACPLRFLYNYVYKLQSKKEKDSIRIGSNWGRCHEILGMTPQGKCPTCLKREEIRPDCYLCDGTGILPMNLMDAVVRFLNWAYETMPEHKTYEQWQVEQITLLYSISAYQWRYADSPFSIVASEIKYDLPVVDSSTNRKIAKARAVGRLDHIIQDKNTGLYYVMERKSTSQSLTTTRYWDYLERNVQTVSYLWAARICQRLGRLERFGIKANDPLIEGVWYDVWHKPDIAPRRTYAKDRVEWEKSNDYYDEPFEEWSDFETPEMYGARLLADIAERPEHYFARREFPITTKKLEKFQQKQTIQAKRIRHDLDKNLWASHEGSCETPFRCDYRDLCFAGIEIGSLDVPDGFKKLESKNDQNNTSTKE